MNISKWIVIGLVTLLATARAANEIVIEAKDFDEGNVRVSLSGQGYADGPACIWHGNGAPERAAYMIEFPVTADYTLSALYAAKDSRPVEISLDGKPVHTGLAGVTGGWNTKSAKWEQQCTVRIECGTHTIALQSGGAPPHICALRLQSSVPFPDGWQLKRLTPEQRAERLRCKAEAALVQTQKAVLEGVNIEAVQRAVADLVETFPGRYDGATHRKALAEFADERGAMLKSFAAGKPAEPAALEKLLAGVRAALLANPLLDFDKLLVVRRNSPGNTARNITDWRLGFVPMGFQPHPEIPKANWDNEIMLLSGLRGKPQLNTLYKPEKGRIIRDVCLDFSADRFLFSSFDSNHRWAVYEMNLADKTIRQVSPEGYPDVDFFDACYLPNGKIVLCSTASYFGLPCTGGNTPIASLYLLDPETKALRQLTFDQDSNAHPTVLNDGRVLYLRWEYSDIPHYFSRRLMTMNPDGTGQLAFYGSNGWFPVGFHFAKPIPGTPSSLVGIIAGHHECGEFGRTALLDPGLASNYPFHFRPESKTWGERELKSVAGPRPSGKSVKIGNETPSVLIPDILPSEQTGFLQLIPGYGQKVAGVVCDMIVRDYYSKQNPVLTVSTGGLPQNDGDYYRNLTKNSVLTTQPYPLSSKYFLVSQKNREDDLWGIYLVDIFDNATLIAEVEGAALFEPVPLMARAKPPLIPDRTTPESQTADVHIADIYTGPGLQSVPRGTVKSLRIFSYHFGYNKKAGPSHVGIQSSWDMKRVLGTAKVESDGSASFQIPANTPISIQPLDGEGRAVQLMRSWLVGMPGERVSCVGCHEQRSTTLPLRPDIAGQRPAEPLTPWYGSPRPFAFSHEVFPVLEKYCMGCHNAAPVVGPRSKPSFKDPGVAYTGLRPYIHNPAMESDMSLLNPMEYHTSTSPLLQMLEKGHHGVKLAELDSESRQRLYCWVDLNAPNSGNWNPPTYEEKNQEQRRCELAEKFAHVAANPEAEYRAAETAFQKRAPVQFIAPAPTEPVPPDDLKVQGFPLTVTDAQRLQQTGSAETKKTVELGNGVKMELARIPTGAFVMGSLEGAPDERPRSVVRVAKPFWMAVTEVNNAQYAAFDPAHDTRYIDMHGINRVTPGYIANHPDQPVARISWQEAMQFCKWMSQKTGLKVTLPTEAQWEWAARAGTDTQFFYGTMDADFGRFANLADQSLRWFDTSWEGRGSLLQKRFPYSPTMNFPLHDERFQDKWFVVDYCGQTEANAWGLKDMIGNVSEWTRSDYRPYPYTDEGRNEENSNERKVARGGSWANRPADAGSAVRRAYAPWQKVYDVGFRVLVEEK
ncbi:MAG: carbohydrate-binding protein [Verrucomicrobia bacterium]|nr:MAG: carbohydrate-binding protein [Verrucomicrobiota bacterium]